MISMEEGQECKTLSIFSDFLMSSLRMYIPENDVHIFIEWFYNGIKKIIEEMILFSSSLDCDSLILVLFWTFWTSFPKETVEQGNCTQAALVRS